MFALPKKVTLTCNTPESLVLIGHWTIVKGLIDLVKLSSNSGGAGELGKQLSKRSHDRQFLGDS